MSEYSDLDKAQLQRMLKAAEEAAQYRLDTLKCWHHHWSYAGPDVAAEIEAKYAKRRERHRALLDALMELNK